MKKVNKIFSIFIIILLICFMISTPVFAVDLSDTTRYNQFSQGSKDKAADNAISDLSSIESADEFKSANGTSSTANIMKGAIEDSSYYKIAAALMSDSKYKKSDGTHYSLSDFANTDSFKNKTYKEISNEYSSLSSIEKKDSDSKISWSKVQNAYDLVSTLEGWESSLRNEDEVLNADESELKNLEWTEIMKKYSTAPTLIEQGKISVVKSWLKTLEKVVDDPLAYNMKDSGYDLEQVRSAVNYLKDLVSKAEDGSTVYKLPKKTSQAETSEASIGDVINDGDVFVNSGNANDAYDATQLQNFSKTIYNILLVAGILVATAMGGILGIKLMTSSVEEKAEVKKLLVPYVIGCVVVFGGFGIWKLVVTILERI